MSFYEKPKAFPVNTEWDYGGEQGYKTSGMDLRDYFAGKALQSLATMAVENDQTPENTATICYMFADAMMEARNGSI